MLSLRLYLASSTDVQISFKIRFLYNNLAGHLAFDAVHLEFTSLEALAGCRFYQPVVIDAAAALHLEGDNGPGRPQL